MPIKLPEVQLSVASTRRRTLVSDPPSDQRSRIRVSAYSIRTSQLSTYQPRHRVPGLPVSVKHLPATPVQLYSALNPPEPQVSERHLLLARPRHRLSEIQQASPRVRTPARHCSTLPSNRQYRRPEDSLSVLPPHHRPDWVRTRA